MRSLFVWSASCNIKSCRGRIQVRRVNVLYVHSSARYAYARGDTRLSRARNHSNCSNLFCIHWREMSLKCVFSVKINFESTASSEKPLGYFNAKCQTAVGLPGDCCLNCCARIFVRSLFRILRRRKKGKPKKLARVRTLSEWNIQRQGWYALANLSLIFHIYAHISTVKMTISPLFRSSCNILQRRNLLPFTAVIFPSIPWVE